MTIERLQEILNAIGPPATPRGIAEILWLAQHAQPPPATASLADLQDSPSRTGLPGETTGERAQDADGATDSAGLAAMASERQPLFVASGAGLQGQFGHAILAPTAPMFGSKLGMQRALRPLKRTAASRHSAVVDERATADRIGRQLRRPRIWAPVLAPAPERWLSLIVVVDTSPSMRMWRPLGRELYNMLLALGAFRDLRIWYMVDNGGHMAVASTPSRAVPLSLRALIDPSARQLMLVLSDCAGPRWWDGRAASAVRLWALSHPTAILQPLPEQLWRRTAAPAVPGLAATTRPCAPNSGLRFTPFEDSDSEPPDAVAVPVLELGRDWLADWAALVIGTGNANRPTAATWLPRKVTAQEPPDSEQQLPIEERVIRFLSVASPQAADLAGRVAVTVPALPVMRLVQRQFIPASEPRHLAEVILSGLLRPLDAERGSYEFVAGAREALLATVPRSRSLQTAEVLRRVSEGIERLAGRTADTFRAYVSVTDGEADQGPIVGAQAFALVSNHALELLSHTAISIHAATRDGGDRDSADHGSAANVIIRKETTASKREDSRPYFFLSYARTPLRYPDDNEDPDRWVYKLYRDLCGVVLQLTDVDAGEAGFMERDNGSGNGWSPDLVNALQRCRVFVPLYSRRYFESKHCGKEWFAFARREITSRARGSAMAVAIVPALWTHMERSRIPRIAQSVQFDDAALGERYCAEGFYGIMKLQNYRADYQRAVHKLAERIVDIGDAKASTMPTTATVGNSGCRTLNRCRVPSVLTARSVRPRASCTSLCWRTTSPRSRQD